MNNTDTKKTKNERKKRTRGKTMFAMHTRTNIIWRRIKPTAQGKIETKLYALHKDKCTK